MRACFYILTETKPDYLAWVEGNEIHYLDKSYQEFKHEKVPDAETYLLRHGYQFTGEIDFHN